MQNIPEQYEQVIKTISVKSILVTSWLSILPHLPWGERNLFIKRDELGFEGQRAWKQGQRRLRRNGWWNKMGLDGWMAEWGWVSGMMGVKMSEGHGEGQRH